MSKGSVHRQVYKTDEMMNTQSVKHEKKVRFGGQSFPACAIARALGFQDTPSFEAVGRGLAGCVVAYMNK